MFVAYLAPVQPPQPLALHHCKQMPPLCKPNIVRITAILLLSTDVPATLSRE